MATSSASAGIPSRSTWPVSTPTEASSVTAASALSAASSNMSISGDRLKLPVCSASLRHLDQPFGRTNQHEHVVNRFFRQQISFLAVIKK